MSFYVLVLQATIDSAWEEDALVDSDGRLECHSKQGIMTIQSRMECYVVTV